MRVRLEIGGRAVQVELDRPCDLALPLDPHGGQPRHFGAPTARAVPLVLGEFTGAVAQGASCNCEVLTLVPHCNGTHTECVGHLTREVVHAYRTVPKGLVPAVLLTVRPERAGATREGTEPAPQAQDELLTRAALERAWPGRPWTQPRAAVLRTTPNDADKATRDYSGRAPAYLSREAAEWLCARGIEHLVVDLPSIDREHDAGWLTAHRVFFGLPPGASELAAAQRPHATITELAFVPDALADGVYLLELQVPAIAGDAVPSRPLLYEVDIA